MSLPKSRVGVPYRYLTLAAMYALVLYVVDQWCIPNKTIVGG